MSIELETFEIVGLHGAGTIVLTLEDNRLILVGENGSGKTTVVNILYHFLARQWHKLSEYQFASLKAVVNGETIELTRLNLEALSRKRPRRPIPRGAIERVRAYIERVGPEEVFGNREYVLEAAHLSGVPTSFVYELLDDYNEEHLGLSGDRRQKMKVLSEIVDEEVLYLPTYRRIEQDLKAVFPEMDQRQLHEQLLRRRTREAGFVELVEFGMEDVKQDTERVLEELREGNRAGLRNLTTRFLGDVIEGRAETISSLDLGEVDPATLDSVFSRVDDATLPIAARKRLLTVLERVGSDADLKVGEKIAAHFLLGLLELHRRQLAAEREIDQFVEVCNRYLTRKHFVFDRSSLSLEIILRDGVDEGEKRTVSLRELSSGEKQIVSLFSHILLSGKDKFFILIDEPELSLSVPWQETFLPDILATGRVTGLIAVTHSPFIYDNTLGVYSRSLEDFRV